MFRSDWEGQTPKTSRLVHGTGIVAMGYVMEALHASDGARGPRRLRGRAAPARRADGLDSGEWDFGAERRRWNGLQNVPTDIKQLAHHLVQALRRGQERPDEAA